MRNTWYIVLFSVAVIMLVLSWPTIDDYLEELDTGWYVSPTATFDGGIDADAETGDTAEQDEESDTDDDSGDDAETETGDTAAEGETGDTAQEDDPTEQAGGTGETTTSLNGYLEYTPTRLETALESDQDVALFFHAEWCPTCKALEADINANNNQITDDQLILKVNYDTATELKQQYGVTTQSTIIHLDSEGEAESVSTTTFTLEDLLAGF